MEEVESNMQTTRFSPQMSSSFTFKKILKKKEEGVIRITDD